MCPLIGSKLDDSKDDSFFVIPKSPPKEKKTKRVLKGPQMFMTQREGRF